MSKIGVRNAHLHNLKHIDIDIPTGVLVAICGVSGSGKSTLAFDVLFEAGRRSYLQALGVLASLGDEHGFDEINGLMPTIAIKQGIVRRSNPRSVVGTKTRLLNYLAALYADQHNRTVSAAETVSPAQFSFNSPIGMCLACQGMGIRYDFDFNVLLPTADTTLRQLYQNALVESTFAERLVRLQEKLGLESSTPFKRLPQEVQDLVLYGKPTADGTRLSPLFGFLKHKLNRGKPVNGAISAALCSECQGHRVGDEARNIVVADKHIGQLGLMTIDELQQHLTRCKRTLVSNKSAAGVERLLIEKAIAITRQLIAVKLDYLTAYRPVPSLSGGEIQRLFLMSHLKAEVAPLLYVFDEPTAGLHEAEKQELIAQLKSLCHSGNSVIVVEHDSQTVQAADHIIDMGPLAGRLGGEVVFEGTLKGLLRCKQSLSGKEFRRQDANAGQARVINRATPSLLLSSVSTNNLNDLDVSIPLGVLVGVAGMSGSGKSSLIADTLVPVLSQRLSDDSDSDTDKPTSNRTAAGRSADSKDTAASVETDTLNLTRVAPVLDGITGTEILDRCIEVSQEPIGRRANSTVASYLGVWDRIRNRFAKTPEAQSAGMTAGHFSFNAVGACEQCHGNGYNTMWLGGSMVSYPCDLCQGQRYQDDVLEVQYNGHNITDVLAATVADARDLFADDQPVSRMFDVMARTGMDYITLGQPTNTLSGGEAQRIKLAKEIGRTRNKQHCVYVLDEPTTGLSLYDTARLMELLQELVSAGNSVIVVEHDPGVLSQCDWLLEMGPGGGKRGGKLIASGTPTKLAGLKKSLIGSYLQV